jgi:hypothetical protein
MKTIEELKYTILLLRREVEVKHRIHMAVNKKENEYINKMEKWLELLEKEEEE